MKAYFAAIDQFAVHLTQWVIRGRYLVVILCAVLAVFMGSKASLLEFSTNYRIFFSQANPELMAFEDLQNTYTKNDNMIFMLVPDNGDVFSNETLAAVEWLTASEQAWQIPYTLRVDSVSNFQHTFAEQDDLIVEDLVVDAPGLTRAERATIAEIAQAEPLLYQQLLSQDLSAVIVNVTLNYPQLNAQEVPESAAKARELKAELQQLYPDIKVYLSGVSMLNNAFGEAGFGDMQSLIPIMFGVIFLLTLLITRSIVGTLGALLIVAFSSMVAMGAGGLSGMQLTPISGQAPTIILTLAIADAIHILMTLRGLMQNGMEKRPAIIEAVRINFLPVGVTSLTTIVGFLSLNFSDSPPFWHMGNLTALGILSAWFFSVTLLPAVLAIFPLRIKFREESSNLMDRLADGVIARPKIIAWVTGGIAAVLIAFIPRIELNDQWTEYFDQSIQFRQDTDQVTRKVGVYPIEFSVPAQGPNQINDPEYLRNLERFAEFLRAQEEITHVYSITDIVKRLNKNLNNDNDDFYRIPQTQAMAAQYLLMYEMSLPYGLDLNDRINIDKSATRVTATFGNRSTKETKIVLNRIRDWIDTNLPDYMQTTVPTSAQVMFTYIAQRNVENMVVGILAALAMISVIMMLTLMNFKLGLFSLLANALPILSTFGLWALIVGEVGFSVAAIASISLGIIVDDTVHFLSKYNRAKSEQRLSTPDSIRYAFHYVGIPVVVNTVILTIGFLVLTLSTFKINFDMGLLTAIAIVFALLLDFLLLPALLLLFDRDSSDHVTPVTANTLSTSS